MLDKEREVFRKLFNSLTTRTSPSLTSVERELERAVIVVDRFNFPHDYYEQQLLTYLEFARYFNLGEEDVFMSCKDLAETRDVSGIFAQEHGHKVNTWNLKRNTSPSLGRSPRLIDMKLYPSYFAAILNGEKTFEGRAYKPDSNKDYPDIRSGDTVLFTVSKEVDGWEEICKVVGINPDMKMKVTVRDAVFGPTVHSVFEKCPGLGVEFQPAVQGPSELLNLQRAGVYYTFPGYRKLIEDNGFIGIELKDPQLIN